ncbi:Uncharacterised protein [Mycobacteroides abscessus subsp. abscessus]|nr:Uncharacterised protein [Mycobacteroides abscessus subsp. abscessus]
MLPESRSTTRVMPIGGNQPPTCTAVVPSRSAR